MVFIGYCCVLSCGWSGKLPKTYTHNYDYKVLGLNSNEDVQLIDITNWDRFYWILQLWNIQLKNSIYLQLNACQPS